MPVSTRHTKGKGEENHGPCSKHIYSCFKRTETQKHSNRWLWYQCLTSTQRETRRLWPRKTSLIRQSLFRTRNLCRSCQPSTRTNLTSPLPSKSIYAKSAHSTYGRALKVDDAGDSRQWSTSQNRLQYIPLFHFFPGHFVLKNERTNKQTKHQNKNKYIKAFADLLSMFNGIYTIIHNMSVQVTWEGVDTVKNTRSYLLY